MPFITQGKTNWKFLLIILVLATIIGGGILGWRYFGSYLGFYIRILTLIIGIGFLIWWYIVLSPEERERKRMAQKEPTKHPFYRVYTWTYAVIVFFAIGLLVWIVISSYLSAREKMQKIQQENIKEEVSTTISEVKDKQKKEQTNIEIYYLRVKGHKVEIEFGAFDRGPLPEGYYKIEILDKDNNIAWEKEINTKEFWYEREHYPYGKDFAEFIEEFEKLSEKGYELEFEKLLGKYLEEIDICIEEVEEKYIDEFYKVTRDLSELYKKGKLKLKEVEKAYDYSKVKKELENILYDPQMAVVRIYYEGDLVAEEYFPETIIIGRITDFSGEPLESARIDFCEKSNVTLPKCGTTFTDKDGDYTIDVFSDRITKLREGLYHLYISPPSLQNLKPGFREINLKNKEVKVVDIVLEQCGSIAGRVVDEEGNPITEAWVYLVGYLTPRYHVCEKEEDCRDLGILLENEECKFYRKMLEFDICKDKKGCEKIQCREIQKFYLILYEKKECGNPLGTFIIRNLEPGNYSVASFLKIEEKTIDLPPQQVKVDLGETAIVNFIFKK